jgi:hypothetical protein
MPSPRARKDDVTRLAQRISSGESGKTETPCGSLKARPMRRRKTWAMLETRRWRRNWVEYGHVSLGFRGRGRVGDEGKK